MEDPAPATTATATRTGDGEVYDLLIMVDLTMQSYLQSLETSLPKILSISTLAGSFSRIGLLAYRDYCCPGQLIFWSEWMDPSKADDDNEASKEPDPVAQAKVLKSLGYGTPHWPSATKTGLAKAYEVIRPEAETIILLYAEAPPHDHNSHHFTVEQDALKDPTSYGGSGPLFGDWMSACRTLSLGTKARVFPILSAKMQSKDDAGNHYSVLSTMTGGACFYLEDSQALTISTVTIDLLLAWMGVEKTGSSSGSDMKAKICRYKTIPSTDIEDETLLPASPFFDAENIEQSYLTSELLKELMPKKKTPAEDFAKRFKSEDAYKLLVSKQLKKIINDDVSAISLNPVFGSLWRAVCNDRLNPSRDDLLREFSLKVDQIQNADEKARMKAWLAESYDFSAEILEIIAKVPEGRLFPCVYLDPTLAFVKPNDVEDLDTEDHPDCGPISAFTREELLELGRSCDYKILRRLGRVLTQISVANTPQDLPAHIVNANHEQVIKIPIALASNEFDRNFFRILLHIVVPGSMLSSRPAALLAALCIRLGVQPLLEAAVFEMLCWRDKWNNLEVPETWNTNCLSLLLDADKSYKLNRQGRTELKPESTDAAQLGLLKDEDRELFDRLVSYKMLELNMKTTLMAKVGWKPEKTFMPVGAQVQCQSCHFPRSVTIMAADGHCGPCVAPDYKSAEEKQERIEGRVAKTDNESTELSWVECNVRTCRAQYVVYHPQELNVRPKCYYCRERGLIAPLVECTLCLSKVIWPEEYRVGDKTMEFKCMACSVNRKTILDVETSAKELCEENGLTWLLINENKKIKEPFNGRSLFHTISTAGTSSFCAEVILFPENFIEDQRQLTLNGKLIRNTPDLRSQLMSWVTRRRTELATCSLCFSSIRKSDILPSCGRSGCHQLICKGCLGGWYGLNAPGRIINIAALSCPFCRRSPTVKTLARHGMGVHAVGDLRKAMAESGEWIHAWCSNCGFAKQHMERVCAAGAPAELEGWNCEECRLSKGLLELKTKECPNCGVLTEKSSGCNHITCSVPKCGAHWCFVCGGRFDEHEIYAHMQAQHGGFYDGDDDDDDAELDEFSDAED